MVVSRDNEIMQLKERDSINHLDMRRMEDEHDSFICQIRNLEEELVAAQKTQAALDEQKQENMALKEIIDRMRFEMDEMRVAAASGLNVSGGSSAKNTISKSLGAEMMKLTDMFGKEDVPVERDDQEEEEEEEEVETEGEDVIQTIITRTKRVSIPQSMFDTLSETMLPCRKLVVERRGLRRSSWMR